MTKRKLAKQKIFKRLETDLWGFFTYKHLLIPHILYPTEKNIENKLSKKARLFFRIVQEKSIEYKIKNKYLRLDLGRPARKKRLRIRSVYSVFFWQAQKLRRYYGEMKQKNFKKICHKALKLKLHDLETKTDVFLYLLESMLIVILLRLNCVTSIYQSRQMITHGQFVLVNNKTINSSSYNLKWNEIFQIKYKREFILLRILYGLLYLEKPKQLKKNILYYNAYLTTPPQYLEVNYRTLSCIILRKKIKYKYIPYYQLKHDDILNLQRPDRILYFYW